MWETFRRRPYLLWFLGAGCFAVATVAELFAAVAQSSAELYGLTAMYVLIGVLFVATGVRERRKHDSTT